MAHRLGGERAGDLSREERLAKLQNSAAYGGVDVPKPPKTTPKPLHATRSSATKAAVAQDVPVLPKRAPLPKSQPAPRRADVKPLPSSTPGVTIRTVNSTRSRLRDTTEAYRQNRGTTAQTIDAVGRDTMTKEKAAQVDRAREKVRRGSSTGPSGRTPAPPQVPGATARNAAARGNMPCARANIRTLAPEPASRGTCAVAKPTRFGTQRT